MNICRYVFYAYISVCMHLCVYACMFICMHVCIHVCIYVILKLDFERYWGNCPSLEGELSGGIFRRQLSGELSGGILSGGNVRSPWLVYTYTRMYTNRGSYAIGRLIWPACGQFTTAGYFCYI